MAINKVLVGESLVNDNDPTGTMAEIAHIDLLIGPRGSAVETAFCNGLCNNKDGSRYVKMSIIKNIYRAKNIQYYLYQTRKKNLKLLV